MNKKCITSQPMHNYEHDLSFLIDHDMEINIDNYTWEL